MGVLRLGDWCQSYNSERIYPSVFAGDEAATYVVVDLPPNAMPVPGAHAHIEVPDLGLDPSESRSDSMPQSSVFGFDLGQGHSWIPDHLQWRALCPWW